MNRDSVDLRKFLLNAVFQRGGYIMHLGNRQRASHRAMAASENVMLHLADAHVMTVYELVEFGRQAVQEIFDRPGELFHFADTRVGCGDVAAERLDVNIYVR